MKARLAIAAMWLSHLLPLVVLAGVGRGFGWLLWFLARERREVCEFNLARCFPELPQEERRARGRRHFQMLGRSILERGLLWWAPRKRLEKLIRVEGLETLERHHDQSIILLAPHFLGLDAGFTRLSCERDLASIYANQKNALFNALLLRGRTRFGHQQLFSRQDGVRAAIRVLRAGTPLYYLPDQDYGARDAVFVPFFGVPAATITGLSRLARITHAVVIPCVTRFLPGGQGYEVRLLPAWEHFPEEDDAKSALRMNVFIEGLVREMPEQYNWAHKRFKTRPPGEAPWYRADA